MFVFSQNQPTVQQQTYSLSTQHGMMPQHSDGGFIYRPCGGTSYMNAVPPSSTYPNTTTAVLPLPQSTFNSGMTPSQPIPLTASPFPGRRVQGGGGGQKSRPPPHSSSVIQGGGQYYGGLSTASFAQVFHNMQPRITAAPAFNSGTVYAAAVGQNMASGGFLSQNPSGYSGPPQNFCGFPTVSQNQGGYGGFHNPSLGGYPGVTNAMYSAAPAVGIPVPATMKPYSRVGAAAAVGYQEPTLFYGSSQYFRRPPNNL